MVIDIITKKKGHTLHNKRRRKPCLEALDA